MKTLVVYFSLKGHTKQVAETLSHILDAELEPIEPYGVVLVPVGGFKALLGMKSAIRLCRTNLKGIDLLVLATPVWAGKVPPYVNTYLSVLSQCEGKPFAVVTQMARSGHESALDHVRKHLLAKGMRFAGSTRSTESDIGTTALEKRLESFAASVLKEAGKKDR
jgi:NAD(P)H-dependent FMN reductase